MFLQILANFDALVEDFAVHILADDIQLVIVHAALAFSPTASSAGLARKVLLVLQVYIDALAGLFAVLTDRLLGDHLATQAPCLGDDELAQGRALDLGNVAVLGMLASEESVEVTDDIGVLQ